MTLAVKKSVQILIIRNISLLQNVKKKNYFEIAWLVSTLWLCIVWSFTSGWILEERCLITGSTGCTAN